LAAAVQPIAPTVPRVTSRWIINRPVDLAFVIGSASAGYAYLILSIVFQVPISFLWWFWSVGFDGTHIFGTASRTYFDAEARSRNRMLLFGSLAFFFALGPLLVVAGWKHLLAIVVGIWAYYHVVRQHYGFMILYKVKNRDLNKLDNLLDRWLLGVMLLFPPYHRFFIHHPEELGIPHRWALDVFAPHAETALWLLIGLVAAGYLLRQAVRLRAGDPLNVPKLLLFGAIFPLHWLTFAYMGWKAAVPTVTIVHNLQYHALIWFHNRNRYAGGAEHGRIPGAVSRSLLAYAGMALVFSALYRIPGFHLGRFSDIAFGFFCGFGLTHYYLDSRIWRVRTDPSLRQALQLA
jgi:hypothetical protein